MSQEKNVPVQKFSVQGLRHEDEPRLERGIRGLRGVLFAVASHQDGCAEIEFEDDMVTVAAIQQAIEELGFPAQPAG